MLDIFALIRNGVEHTEWPDLGKTFDSYVEKNEEEYHLLVRNWDLMDKWSINRLFEKYYIQELFEIANCYLGFFNGPYMYWHITKKKPETIKTAIYFDYAHPYRDNEDLEGKLRIPDRYTEEYKQYISRLENWVESGELPSDIKSRCEFNEIEETEFDYTKPYARFYRKANIELRGLLRTTEIVPLKAIADVIKVTAVNGGNDVTRVKSLDPNKTPTYPYIPELQAVDNIISTEKIHKDDIVELGRNKFFLIDKESDFDLYAPRGRHVIKAKKVSPEYLYLYLNSRTAQRIMFVYNVPLGDYATTSLGGDLAEFPVIVPKEDDAVYKNRFLQISSPDKRYYVTQDEASKPETIEQVLEKELKERIKLNSDALIKKQIDEDIAELNICYANKAYKSTLILAGSIMEALLIDWLSEIRGIDYFKDTLQKRLYDKVNRCYATDNHGNYIYIDKRADLADYIDEIRDIKRPRWMVEAKEAHRIRDKRNLVHAKLCLKRSAEISDETCKEVINYLKHIIESRWKE